MGFFTIVATGGCGARRVLNNSDRGYWSCTTRERDCQHNYFSCNPNFVPEGTSCDAAGPCKPKGNLVYKTCQEDRGPQGPDGQNNYYAWNTAGKDTVTGCGSTGNQNEIFELEIIQIERK